MDGFFNSLLRINLSNRTFAKENVADEVLRQHLGGKGLGTYLLLREIKPGVDPLSSENKLMFTCGSATGTKMIGASRYGVYSKSPLTGIYAESYSGGWVAPQMKATGYDAFIFEGTSETPVYVEISDSKIVFHEATHLWGLDTFQAEDKILKEVGQPKAQAVVIGPAGENLVRFACIVNNHWRCAGRCGLGAIMGSKKLKAVVFHGKAKCQLADEKMLDSYVKDLIKVGRENPAVKMYQKYGTPMQVAVMNKAGAFPTQYYARGHYEKWENLSADYLLREFEVKPKACYRCFLACSNLSKVKKGPYKGLLIEGPEYETIGALGGLCCLNNLEEVAYLNDICDRMGIDTITTGHMVSFAIEASKRGKIDINLNYGDVEGIANLIKDICKRKKDGNLLAEGIKVASNELGLEDIAIHVKGLEPALMDPRVLKGMGLAYVVSTRGACHLRCTFYKLELSGEIDPDKIDGKVQSFVDLEDRCTIFDTLILCRFLRDLISWDDLRTIIEATMGLQLDISNLRRLANNITTSARIFNVREGITKNDDVLPERFYREPLGEDKKIFRKEDLDKMLSEYYHLRGWNERGIPQISNQPI